MLVVFESNAPIDDAYVLSFPLTQTLARRLLEASDDAIKRANSFDVALPALPETVPIVFFRPSSLVPGFHPSEIVALAGKLPARGAKEVMFVCAGRMPTSWRSVSRSMGLLGGRTGELRWHVLARIPYPADFFTHPVTRADLLRFLCLKASERTFPDVFLELARVNAASAADVAENGITIVGRPLPDRRVREWLVGRSPAAYRAHLLSVCQDRDARARFISLLA